MIPNKQKLIYIASPYSHSDKRIMDSREVSVTKVAADLTVKYGYSMFLPITQSAPMERLNSKLSGNFNQWASIDLFLIKEKCDELWVVMLEGWKESVGVREEIKCAEENNKPIFFYDPFEKRFL